MIQKFEAKVGIGYKGELVKLNLYQCRCCQRIHVPAKQSSKASGLESGWHQNIASVRSIVEADKTIDPVLRKRTNRKTCPDCKEEGNSTSDP